jgi:hypothetical protein
MCLILRWVGIIGTMQYRMRPMGTMVTIGSTNGKGATRVQRRDGGWKMEGYRAGCATSNPT